MNNNDFIFIKGNVPSSKNSKQWTGKILIWSKAAYNYKKSTEIYWIKNKVKFKNMISNKNPPYNISFKFIRGSKHKFDYVNPLQTVLDLMVMYKWINDDNADMIFPIFEKYQYDKYNAGVEIKVL